MEGGAVADGTGSVGWRIVFGDCIRHILKSWSALNFAVNYGGKKTEEKRASFFSELVTLFATGDRIASDKYRLTDWLRDKMLTEFNMDLEDDSDTEIASLICDLYSTLSHGDHSLAQKVLQTPERNSVANCPKPAAADTSDDGYSSDESGSEPYNADSPTTS